MRNSIIEQWALNVIRRVANNQAVEDSRVELKSKWPTDYYKTARQIAGHANSARGERILWLIGVDEKAGVQGAGHMEPSEWLGQVIANFDQLSPRYHDLNVPTNAGQTVVAFVFETDRAPFVVKNPQYGSPTGGPISLEVPWREGGTTRTATRADLLLVLSDFRSLRSLLSELQWNSEVASRSGARQEQYRVSEYERAFSEGTLSALNKELEDTIRDAYIAISHAQSFVRTLEAATNSGTRGNLNNESISVRLAARPLIEAARKRLAEFLSVTE